MQEGTNWKDLADQLSHPHGEAGVVTGKQMQQTNANMISRTIDTLGVAENDKVLEIGFGNGAHVPYLLGKKPGIHYTGIDISETMLQEALAVNVENVLQRKAFFILSNGATIPFADNTFNRIFTVNTIYFWKNPQQYASEIQRVLKPGGRCNISFGSKDFMETLPFVQYGFKLFELKAVEDLLKTAGLILEANSEEAEQVKTNAGELVTRKFIIVSATKLTSHSGVQYLY